MNDDLDNMRVMRFFEYKHLPEKLQDVSRSFCELAQFVNSTIQNCKEKEVALRKLLEAKDCAVRALL